jgi:hypothetical protein
MLAISLSCMDVKLAVDINASFSSINSFVLLSIKSSKRSLSRSNRRVADRANETPCCACAKLLALLIVRGVVKLMAPFALGSTRARNARSIRFL